MMFFITSYDVNLDYFSVLYCCACLQNGAQLIGLNKDRHFYYGKCLIPASGCTLRFLETATGKQATIIGKPSSFMFEIIAKEHDLKLCETVMIGDSMESDILMGINANIDTILVLSGVTKLDQISSFNYSPSLVLDSLSSIIE